ncbi:MAG: hypothetical protein ACOX2R_07610 [Anaerolineae bacterium]|jgi:hypothetical protein
MEAFINDSFLKRRRKLASWSTYVAIGALVLGLIMSTRQLAVSYALLLVGMLGATVGSQLTAAYVREPRADSVLTESLSGMDKRFSLYCYYLPSHHVVASHHGMTVLMPRAQKGEVAYERGKWRHKAGARKLMQLFGEPALGRPDLDAQQEAKWVEEWVQKALPELEVPISSVIVFTDPDVTLFPGDSPVPAVKVADLPAFLREGLKELPTLPTASQKELRRTLEAVVQADA